MELVKLVTHAILLNFCCAFFFQSIMRRNMAEKDKTASNGCMDYFAAAWIGFLTDGE